MAGKLVEHTSFCNQIISKAPATPFDAEVFAAQKREDAEFIDRYFNS